VAELVTVVKWSKGELLAMDGLGSHDMGFFALVTAVSAFQKVVIRIRVFI
jgi:hypothetical protein